MLKQLIIAKLPLSLLLGPVGVFTTMLSSFQQGLIGFLYFIATFSIAVGFVNLLPIPGLDGGSVIYALIEKIRKKPISVGLEILLLRLAFIVFCVIIVQLIFNDIERYVK